MNLKLANEIASNVLQSVQPYGSYLTENPIKHIKIVPIIIEGLDCVGKNTLSNSILSKIKEETDDVIMLSFPDYTSESGNEILQILHMEGTRSALLEQKLWTLMIRNRMEALAKLRDTYDVEKDSGRKYYLILDRFFLSNLAYGVEPQDKSELLELINDSPVYKLAEFESDTYFKFFNNNGEGVSIILSYNENDPDKAYIPGLEELIKKSIAIHKEFLDKKENKDSNENMKKQAIVSSIYDLEGIDRKFHKVKHFLRYRPNESLSDDAEARIIPQIMEALK